MGTDGGEAYQGNFCWKNNLAPQMTRGGAQWGFMPKAVQQRRRRCINDRDTTTPTSRFDSANRLAGLAGFGDSVSVFQWFHRIDRVRDRPLALAK